MAIVIHAARATRDWHPVRVRRGDRTYHILSDQAGPEGIQELDRFITVLGYSTRWVQYAGTYREHFDAPGNALDELLAAGARLITTRELGHLLAAKRAVMGSLPPSART